MFADEILNIAAAQYYDSIAERWIVYDRDVPPWLSTDFTVTEKMGIWVLFDTDATLSVTGPGLVSTMMDLIKGWNMIGYPSGTPDTVANVLAGALYTEVWGYDGVALYRLKQLAPTDMLEPGHGYWVHVTADSSYTQSY